MSLDLAIRNLCFLFPNIWSQTLWLAQEYQLDSMEILSRVLALVKVPNMLKIFTALISEIKNIKEYYLFIDCYTRLIALRPTFFLKRLVTYFWHDLSIRCGLLRIADKELTEKLVQDYQASKQLFRYIIEQDVFAKRYQKLLTKRKEFLSRADHGVSKASGKITTSLNKILTSQSNTSTEPVRVEYKTWSPNLVIVMFTHEHQDFFCCNDAKYLEY